MTYSKYETEFSTFKMENQMETGTKKIVKKEEDNDRFSTMDNAGDRKKPLEKAKRSIGSMFRRSVNMEISPAVVENTESGQLAKPVKKEPSQPASSGNVMKKEETRDNWSTMVLPEMPLSTSHESTTEQTRTKKMHETRSSQPSQAKKFMNGALGDTSVSSVRTAVPAVQASAFMATSKLNGAHKAKRTATIASSPIKMNSIGSSPDAGSNNNSILESGSEDHSDGGSDVDEVINETGLRKRRHIEANTIEAKDDCDGGEKPFKCDVCRKKFTTNGQLTSHKRIHTGGKPFECLTCHKRFTRSNDLQRHNLIHTGERPFKCDICAKKFNRSGHLTVHKRFHSGNKPFKCDVCKKCFTQSGDLRRHKLIHTGAKPFECLICHKRFTHSGSLLKHNVIHTGEKPFKCDVCKKCFSESGNLTSHKRIHTGEKPFVCDICKKCFTESGTLKRHKLIHTGEKPYKCPSCGLCFRHNCNLLKHIRTQHSDGNAGSQVDAPQNGMDQSATTDAYDPLDNSINGQKILYKSKSLDYMVEKMANRNPDVVYLVWSKKFTMELASAVARSGYNCILCVEKIQPQPFRDVVKLSDGLHTCVVEVGPDSKTLRLFSFGGMFLPEKITDHGRFKTLAKLESKMRRFSQSEGMEMVNIFKHSEGNSGWYRSLRDGLKGESIITDYV